MARRAKPKSKAQTKAQTKVRSAAGAIGRLFRGLLILLLVFGLIGPVAVVTLYRFAPPPLTFLMVQRIFEGRGFDRRWVPLSDISPRLVGAVIASEDSGFCRHNGFDMAAIRKALSHNAKDPNRLRGGSTISQQTAKNVFLIQGGGYVRKGFEAWFTFLIEHLWGKRRIMEVYLNVAETGIGTYGANAGSIRYFGHDASRMSSTEAGRIAAVLPLPKKRAAIDPRGFVRRHGNALAKYVNVVRGGGLDSCLH